MSENNNPQNLPATQTDRAPVEQVQQRTDVAPFARMVASGQGGNVAAIEIESQRAIAEAQGQLTLAKKFPRSMSGATAEFMDACASIDFAKTAFYTVPNRGTGPSIRFAEEAARCYGNFQYGHRELSRMSDRSEIEVYAWDMQNNNYSKRQITVMHVLDTREHGPRKLTDQADIDNKIANVASKQMRGRILALLPKALVAAGQTKAKQTLAGGGTGEKPLRERVTAMAQAFSKFGVNDKMLAAYLKHAVDDTTIDELADLTGIYNAIKEGGKASEYFKPEESATAGAATAKAITNAAKGAGGPTGAPPPTGGASTPPPPAQTPAPAPATTTRRQQAAGAPAATPKPATAPPPPAAETPAPPAQPDEGGGPPDDDIPPDDGGGGTGAGAGGGNDQDVF